MRIVTWRVRFSSRNVHRHCFAGHIHARGWLIQYEHVRFGGQCARQHHALLLTRGEVPKQVAAKGLDSEKRQRAVRRVPVGATYSPQRRGLRAWSHEHHFQHRDGNNSFDSLALWNVTDAQARLAVGHAGERPQRPSMVRSSVVFPDPLGPTIPRMSPRATSNERSRKSARRPYPSVRCSAFSATPSSAHPAHRFLPDRPNSAG